MLTFTPPHETTHAYLFSESSGVMSITVAGLFSLAAVLLLLIVAIPRTTAYYNTHILGYFVSLLVANIVQSTGTVMNLQWIRMGGIVSGPFCSAQGGIKQAGNIGTALWSFMISLHLFNLLFLRYPTTKVGFSMTIVVGWAIVVFIVAIGPIAIQSKTKGPYFGISGPWCWITPEYPKEQLFLEYFLEFLSAGLGFLLYTAVLLRVRGNLFYAEGKWHLRVVPHNWQLSFARDLIDSSMLRVARHMVWYPIVYSIVVIPVCLARLPYANDSPFLAKFVTATLFNLNGFLNVILFLVTRHVFPEAGSLPEFTTPRKQIIDGGSSDGVTPFTLSQSEATKFPLPAVTTTTATNRHLRRSRESDLTTSTAHAESPF